MLLEYLPLVLVLAVSLIFGIVATNASWLFGPRRPDPEKLSTYESGMTPVRTARQRFSVRFYMVAMLFIVFDIEVVFMYPWAVRFKDLGWFGFWEMLVFVGILMVGYGYIVKKGALEWD